jgi:CheY-like chemotaxis protein
LSQILIVDDDTVILYLMKDALSEAGFAIESAESGKEAIEQLKKYKFCVLVTDILMPDITGLEVIDFAVTANPDISILAISGGGTNEKGGDLLDLALSAGADAVLEKPFRPDELVRTVMAIMR